MDITEKEILTCDDAARYLDLTTRFLEARRIRGDGPPFVRISQRCVRYRKSDLDKWLAERLHASTSATSAIFAT